MCNYLWKMHLFLRELVKWMETANVLSDVLIIGINYKVSDCEGLIQYDVIVIVEGYKV
jgi:hypothetical protein